ncbi:S8 family serine peptidase [Paraclostridium bifermentans]|uniref:S8 family serine peptidase n=1 Tax=Paraclostridium bifermentans TaxID=1490 RepID=UPI0018AADC4E|nr:S8 family serine peptidase [Paraclostridium bifermentans]
MENKVKVAIVDTGIDKNNIYLKDNIIGGVAFECKDNYIILSENYNDENGHGTSCASIIKKEYENVEIFVVKVLDRFGNTNIQVLEESLKYLLKKDIQVISLSLSVVGSEIAEDLYKVCEELSKQGKIIVSSVYNGSKSSYPAKFDNVIGVKGFILEDENSIWYNESYDIQCVLDNNPYLCCDLNNRYRLFGRCNSQAAAKLAGKISKIISKNQKISFKDLNKTLEDYANKNYWTEDDIKVNKRYPKVKTDNVYKYSNLIDEIVDEINDVLPLVNDKSKLYEECLFSKEIGLNDENCYDVLISLEKRFNLNIDYMNTSKYDFVSIHTLADLINKYISKEGE